jgi:hypothetical protein
VPTPSSQVLCPRCGYDLAPVTGDAGVCPECGDAFSKDAIRSRLAAVLLVSLALVGWGGLGSLVTEALGVAVTYMPRTNEGTGGNGTIVARMLGVAPLLLMATGIGMLGWLSGQTRWQRIWPALAGALLAASTLYGVALARNGLNDGRQPIWLQPQNWVTAHQWVSQAAGALTVVAAAAALRRILVGTARSLAGVIMVVACVGLALRYASSWHGVYLQSLNRPLVPTVGRGTMPAPGPFYSSWAMNGALAFLADLVGRGAWAAVAVLAVVTHALSRRPGR